MINIRKIACILTLLVVSTPIYATKKNYVKVTQQQYTLHKESIDNLMNIELQKNIKAMIDGSFVSTNTKQSTYILIAAMEEESSYELISFLIPYYKSHNLRFNKHQVMLKALDLGSVKIVEYLLKHKVYSSYYLSTKQQYGNFLFLLDKLHTGYILFWDCRKIKFLPSIITSVWSVISIIRGTISFLGNWIGIAYCKKIDTTIKSYLSFLDIFFSLKIEIIKYFLCVFIRLYQVIMATHKPGYLFYLLTHDIENKDKKEVEDLILLILKHNLGNPNERGLLVKVQDEYASMLPEGLNLYAYLSTTLLHFAVKYNMLRLTKELIKRGANVNAIAFAMKDTINYPSEKENLQSVRFPFNFVTAPDLYYLKKGKKQTPLDVAGNESAIGKYLKAHGGKVYSSIKKTKKRKTQKKKK